MGVFPELSLRSMSGEGTLRGAGEGWPSCEGVDTRAEYFLLADEGCDCSDVFGVAMLSDQL